MRFLLFLLFFIQLSAYSQVKTLIPEDEEVDLPTNDNGTVGLTTSFDETKIRKETMTSLFIWQIKESLHKDYYYIIDTGQYYIEMFIVYPCKSFNIHNIQKHEIINEGIITSSLRMEFNDSTYTIELSNFEWVNNKKENAEIDAMYKNYQSEKNLIHKIRYYGILKSCEYSISETISNLTELIDKLMQAKSKQFRKTGK